jgi:hypothetical protein
MAELQAMNPWNTTVRFRALGGESGQTPSRWTEIAAFKSMAWGWDELDGELLSVCLEALPSEASLHVVKKQAGQ